MIGLLAACCTDLLHAAVHCTGLDFEVKLVQSLVLFSGEQRSVGL